MGIIVIKKSKKEKSKGYNKEGERNKEWKEVIEKWKEEREN